MRVTAKSRFVVSVAFQTEGLPVAGEQPAPMVASRPDVAVRAFLETFDAYISFHEDDGVSEEDNASARRVIRAERDAIEARLLLWDYGEPFVWDDGDFSRDEPSIAIRVDHVQEVR